MIHLQQEIICVPSFLIIAQELVLEVLQAITSNTQIIKEAINKGIHCLS